MSPSVTITESGREGAVTYREGSRGITGYQEFGGASVVAIVSMGSVEDWRSRHPWALDRRMQILQYIADEVIRQKAPGCSADINEASGDIVLRKAGASAAGLVRAARSSGAGVGAGADADAHWVFRFSRLKARFATIVLVIALVLGVAAWIKAQIPGG